MPMPMRASWRGSAGLRSSTRSMIRTSRRVRGTVALEMLEDTPQLDCMVTPIGGGGLISGMSTVARSLRPGMEVIGVQSALFPSMFSHIKREERLCGGDTLAEGIAVKAPGKFTSQIIAERVDDILLADEPALEKAVSLLLQIEKNGGRGGRCRGAGGGDVQPRAIRWQEYRVGAVRR